MSKINPTSRRRKIAAYSLAAAMAPAAVATTMAPAEAAPASESGRETAGCIDDRHILIDRYDHEPKIYSYAYANCTQAFFNAYSIQLALYRDGTRVGHVTTRCSFDTHCGVTTPAVTNPDGTQEWMARAVYFNDSSLPAGVLTEYYYW